MMKRRLLEIPFTREIFDEADNDSPSFPIPDMPEPIPPVEVVDDSEIQSLIASVLRPEKAEPVRFDPEKAPSQGSPVEPVDGLASLPPEKLFNPDKTMGIDEVVDSVYEEPEADPDPIPVFQREDIMNSSRRRRSGIGFLMKIPRMLVKKCRRRSLMCSP